MSILDDIEAGKVRVRLRPEAGEVKDVAMRLHYSKACIGTEICDWAMALYHSTKQKELYQELQGEDPPKAAENTPEYRMVVRTWAAILCGIANAYHGLGDHRSAQEYYEQGMRRGESEILSAYPANLCRSWLATGEVGGASERLEKLASLREARFGVDDVKDYM